MGALGMFSRAQIATLKSLGIWVAAIGGLLLATLLLFTGRLPLAISALMMLGPLVWSWVAQVKPTTGGARPVPRSGPMTRAEAYEVLGLRPGASAAAIKTAHLNLMRSVHPDHGGSDWLAARINQARDVLLSS
jgi:hypothetical protein